MWQFKLGNWKKNGRQFRQLETGDSFMVSIELELFMLVLATTIISFVAFIHATFTALLIVVMPETHVDKLVHAVMEMHRRSGGGREVEKRKYGNCQFHGPAQKYKFKRLTGYIILNLSYILLSPAYIPH
jgi:hypothetical protein